MEPSAIQADVQSTVIPLRPLAAGRRLSPFTVTFLLEAVGFIIVTLFITALVLGAFVWITENPTPATGSPPIEDATPQIKPATPGTPGTSPLLPTPILARRCAGMGCFTTNSPRA